MRLLAFNTPTYTSTCTQSGHRTLVSRGGMQNCGCVAQQHREVVLLSWRRRRRRLHLRDQSMPSLPP
jgi:hypothetical protein